MVFAFTKEQIENLKSWKPGLETEEAKTWTREEDQAELTISKLFETARFKEGNDLTPEQLDKYFHILRYFSNNRSLSNLLYRKNGIKQFNHALRFLLYSEEPIHARIEEMFKLKGIGVQTVSQFLMASDSSKYPLISRQTVEVLGLDPIQEKQAQEEAISHFGIKEPNKLYPDTLQVLRSYIVFYEIKKLLNLEKFSQANNLIWFGRKESGVPISEPKDIQYRSSSKIILDGLEYAQKEFAKEEEFEAVIENNAKTIFGKNCTYYSLKRKIGLRICDGLLYDKENNRVIVVENEIQGHDLYEHIVPQIIGFFNGMKEESTKLKLKHNITWAPDEKLAIIEAIDYHQYDVLVVIDAADFNVLHESRNISNILRSLVGEKYNPAILFKEVGVYENKEGKRVFRVRDL